MNLLFATDTDTIAVQRYCGVALRLGIPLHWPGTYVPGYRCAAALRLGASVVELCYSPPMPAETSGPGNHNVRANSVLYCPSCAVEVTDPLVCGDCSAVICRVCGTPLESPDELGIG